MLEEASDTLLTSLSGDRIEEAHRMAYVYYQNKHYREADALYRLLVAACPQNHIYWKGLGACLKMKNNYKDALNCYRCAQALLKDQPDPYLEVHAADCYFALKQIEQGLKALDRAKLIAMKQNDQAILQHVSFMRERWKKQKAS